MAERSGDRQQGTGVRARRVRSMRAGRRAPGSGSTSHRPRHPMRRLSFALSCSLQQIQTPANPNTRFPTKSRSRYLSIASRAPRRDWRPRPLRAALVAPQPPRVGRGHARAARRSYGMAWRPCRPKIRAHPRHRPRRRLQPRQRASCSAPQTCPDAELSAVALACQQRAAVWIPIAGVTHLGPACWVWAGNRVEQGGEGDRPDFWRATPSGRAVVEHSTVARYGWGPTGAVESVTMVSKNGRCVR